MCVCVSKFEDYYESDVPARITTTRVQTTRVRKTRTRNTNHWGWQYVLLYIDLLLLMLLTLRVCVSRVG